MLCDVSDVSDGSDASDVSDGSDASDGDDSDSSDVSDVSDVDGSDVSDVSDVWVGGGIGKASETSERNWDDPSNEIENDTPRDPLHRKGIGRI